jgi:hypothetical protein
MTIATRLKCVALRQKPNEEITTMYKMIQHTWLGLIALLAVLALSGCASAGLIGAAPLATATLSPVAAVNAPTVAPTVAPTATPIPLPTATMTAAPVPTATATRRPTTVPPRATATPVVPPGVYVTAIKVDPSAAKSNQTPQFTVTFLNTTAQTQRFTWYIKIFSSEQPNSFGETTKISNDIPANTSRLPAIANWRTQTYFGCLSFTARAFWVDPNGDAVEFLKPDGSNLGAPLSVCP